MIFTPAILALPLLASAIPTSKHDQLILNQTPNSDIASLGSGTNDYAGVIAPDFDLNELRLVQFSDEEPPV